MDAASQESNQAKTAYTTPHRVQVWFLSRSRKRWKQKYQHLKVEAKRLQNRVADVTKSREKWRRQAQELNRRVQELEAETVALHQQAAALKKDGPDTGPRPD
jgi:chromosome segregation ATPase